MRIFLCIVSVGIIILGLLLISKSFEEPALAPATARQSVSATEQKATPLGLGLALLIGGVLFLVMVCRKR